MKQFLVLAALGEEQPQTLTDIAEAVQACGCSIVQSRMTVFGKEFALLLLVSGNWNTITRLEGSLARLGQRLGLTISARRTAESAPRRDLVPYAVDAICVDQIGIVHGLAGFFTERKIMIADLTTRSYAAAHTGAPMFAVQMVVNVPADMHIAGLREEFMDFCDRLNLDAIIEPIKS
jgi:glycine cleavage system transcriptional repressor